MDKLQKTSLALQYDTAWFNRLNMAMELEDVEIERKPQVQVTYELADKIDVTDLGGNIFEFSNARVSDEELLQAVRTWKAKQMPEEVVLEPVEVVPEPEEVEI